MEIDQESQAGNDESSKGTDVISKTVTSIRRGGIRHTETDVKGDAIHCRSGIITMAGHQ